MQSIETFDPNAQPEHHWGTFCPDRFPKWKLHKRPQDARAACLHAYRFILYTWKDGRWEEVTRDERRGGDVTRCDVCCAENPTRTFGGGVGGRYQVRDPMRPVWMWDPQTGKRLDPPRRVRACGHCRLAHR